MGVYIKGKLPTEFNGITMKEAVYWADIYLQDNPCDRMWDAIRALRDFCECVTDEAIEVTEPHGRIIDESQIKTVYGEAMTTRYQGYISRTEKITHTDAPTVIEAEGDE